VRPSAASSLSWARADKGVTPLLDRKEIDIEIARLEYGESSYPAYAKLADLYTIRDRMDRAEAPDPSGYERSYSATPAVAPAPPLDGESDFLRAAAGKDPSGIWDIMDDLMDTLRAVNPRAYAGVMRKIYSL